ncbi:response regulator transcription factor [Nocardia noduli]|uniref:response regulator transcription factor n=1 Tax=Nocardia noduli TaxID=2815722 RepID=UPI001C2284A1|nr:response regulator transcription factor [Nocardia noduli]
MRVLIAEDDHDLAKSLSEDLESQGFTCLAVDCGQGALEAHSQVEAVILDIGLPDIDGFEVCRRIRATSMVPIVFLSGRSDEFDRVLALKLGADDYVMKPYRLRELAARIEAVTRRNRRDPIDRDSLDNTDNRNSVRNVRQLRIDTDCRRITISGNEIALTRKEFEVLELLTREPGKVFSRETIMIQVWGHDGSGDTRTLGVHMTSLRKKLGTPLIETVRGIGFRLAL